MRIILSNNLPLLSDEGMVRFEIINCTRECNNPAAMIAKPRDLKTMYPLIFLNMTPPMKLPIETPKN